MSIIKKTILIIKNASVDNSSDEEQYKQSCHYCGLTLGIDVPIMCWTSKSGKTDRTYCNWCYWDSTAWKHDNNEDNADENPKVLKNIKATKRALMKKSTKC